jgi:hypothetical protein
MPIRSMKQRLEDRRMLRGPLPVWIPGDEAQPRCFESGCLSSSAEQSTLDLPRRTAMLRGARIGGHGTIGLPVTSSPFVIYPPQMSCSAAAATSIALKPVSAVH